MDVTHISCGPDGWAHLVAIVDCHDTPYTPQQNGLIERFFRSLKEECVWLTSFDSFQEAKQAVERWIRWYNQERPHQALDYLSPSEFRHQRQAVLMAA